MTRSWAGHTAGSGQRELRTLRAHISAFLLCPFQVVPSIFPHAEQEDRPNPAEAGGPDRKSVGTWALKSERALILAVRRACLAQRIEGLDWELSLLLQVAEGSTCAGGSQPSLGRR